jgi:hypothetical protein
MTLEEIIATKIPNAMLERVVCDQDLIGLAERGDLFKPSGSSADQVASRVLASYGRFASRLALGLYEQVKTTDWQTAELLIEHLGINDPDFHNHQASLVSRIPDLSLGKLSDFLTVVTGQICLIVSSDARGRVELGTGFLVGPDLVLTCKHVLKNFPVDGGIPNSKSIELYFDYCLGGPVDRLTPALPNSRKVALAANWHVANSPDANPDGILEPLQPAAAALVSRSLDFVLLRLAEKVGLQADRNGGRRRKWVDLSAAGLPQNVQDEDWVIIPQHPKGHPQRIDLGRFRTFDCTLTRLRYDTNTAPGTSGAPCFNQDFKLVGVHNAYVGPGPNPTLNQAIRATCIARQVQQYIAAAEATTHIDRWSVTPGDEEPRVILGRETLLSWLRPSATAKTDPLAHRIYAACADVPAAGCTFSIDVMQAETRDTKTPRAVYGQRGQQLPATAEDFLLSLLRELGIALDADQTIPYRPRPLSAEAATIGTGEVDKLERWISQELPEWLGRVINRHVEKEIDARPRAIDAVKFLASQNIEVPKKLRATADSEDPVIVRANAWDFAYVVFDDLRSARYPGTGPRTELKGEILSLVAALARGKSEAELAPGLGRLRWMFLGYLPDFIAAASAGRSGATVEVLEPAAVGEKEILSIFERMSEAHVQMQEGATLLLPIMAATIAEFAARSPAPKLAALQAETSGVAKRLLSRLGK